MSDNTPLIVGGAVVGAGVIGLAVWALTHQAPAPSGTPTGTPTGTPGGTPGGIQPIPPSPTPTPAPSPTPTPAPSPSPTPTTLIAHVVSAPAYYIRATFADSQATQGQDLAVTLVWNISNVGRVEMWGYNPPDVEPTSTSGFTPIGVAYQSGQVISWNNTKNWRVGNHVLVFEVYDTAGARIYSWTTREVPSNKIIEWLSFPVVAPISSAGGTMGIAGGTGSLVPPPTTTPPTPSPTASGFMQPKVSNLVFVQYAGAGSVLTEGTPIYQDASTGIYYYWNSGGPAGGYYVPLTEAVAETAAGYVGEYGAYF